MMSPSAINGANGNGALIRGHVGPLDVILRPSRGSGLIAAQLLTRRGSADETEEEYGLASFVAAMLKRGTPTRDSARIAFELESLGAMTGYGAGVDSTSASIQSAAGDFPAALDVFFDCLRNPTFDARELEAERRSFLAHIKRLEDDKFDYTYRHYLHQIFAGHGYGHPPDGEKEQIEAITIERCRAWHDRIFQPANMLMVAAGDFDADAFRSWIEPHVKDWTPRGESPARYGEPTPPPVQSSSLVLEKELEQGFVIIGFRAPEVGHPDYAALRLACAVLGEGFAGRLFTHLRDERSLAYAVGSFVQVHRLGGHIVLHIGTKPESLEEARVGLLEEAEKVARIPLSHGDLERARQYVVGKYLMDHQSLASRAGYLARWDDVGVGAEYDFKYVDDLRHVTTEQVTDAARRWWINPTVVVLRPKK